MMVTVEAETEQEAIGVRRLGVRIVMTTFVGKTMRTHSERAWPIFRDIVGDMDRPVWVSDATRLTGFEPSSLSLGARWFELFRKRGGRHCLVVTRWPTAIMAAGTMALGMGVRVRGFSTMAEAREAAMRILDE